MKTEDADEKSKCCLFFNRQIVELGSVTVSLPVDTKRFNRELNQEETEQRKGMRTLGDRTIEEGEPDVKSKQTRNGNGETGEIMGRETGERGIAAEAMSEEKRRKTGAMLRRGQTDERDCAGDEGTVEVVCLCLLVLLYRRKVQYISSCHSFNMTS